MLGLWVALPDGRRCLVVATGIVFTTGQQALLVAPRDGGRRLAVPWQHGGSEAVIIQKEPRSWPKGDCLLFESMNDLEAFGEMELVLRQW